MTLPSYVGRYAVRGEIARGGFAVVVKAWDEELECLVALKILHDSLTDDPQIEQRFLQEARLLRRVNSPHVVAVHDVGRLNDGRPYFVLDFADRGTLSERLSNPTPDRTLSGQCLVPLIDAMAEGLDAVHQSGLIHRDIKPGNILFQSKGHLGASETTPAADTSPDATGCTLIRTDERVLVGDLGIAKDVIRDGNFPTLIGGSPLYLAPEQNDPASELSPAVDIYAATAVLWHVLTGRSPPTSDRIADQLSALAAPWQEVVRQGMAVDPALRHTDVGAWRAAVNTALQRVITDTQSLAPSRTAICPYMGLAAYQADDARFFCGRESLVDELIRRVQLHQVLVVGGPSGSGKSSLVRAGLLPALKSGGLPGSENWRMLVMTPGRDPLSELCEQLDVDRQDLPRQEVRSGQDSSWARRLIESAALAERHALLFVDQFEETFTLATPSRRAEFFAVLSALTELATSRVKLVIAVRADFYNVCAQVPWLAGNITNNQVLVGPMTRSELRRAITEPARRAGLYLEQGLVEAVLEEAGSEAGSLPLMAHALVETWVRRRGNTLTLDGFRAAGGVAGAISQTADATYKHGLDDADRQVAKRLFLRLVTPSEGVPETRRALPRSEIALDEEPTAVDRVVEQLTAARLLTIDDDRLQIAHEALLRTWPRLRSWIEESRDDLRMRQKIHHATVEWQAEGREEDLLYHGTPLLSALEWRARHTDQLGSLEREFLDAAEAYKARLDAAAAEKLRRTRRWRRAAVIALAALAIVTSSSALIAYRAANEARTNAQRAAAATAEAQERFAAALGSAAFGHVREDPRLALALAAEAIARSLQTAPSYDTRAAIIAARQALHAGRLFVRGSPVPAGDALAIALSPDGSLLAIAQAGGSIELVDTRTLKRREPPLSGHVGAVRALAFDDAGRQLVSVGVDATVRLWPIDIPGERQPRLLGKTEDIIMDVCIHPSGSSVVTGSADGTVRVWDTLGLGAAREPIAKLPLEFNVVACTPDGSAVLAATNDARIHAWSVTSYEPVFPAIDGPHSGHLLGLAFAPGGDRVATVSTDGSSVLVRYPQGEVIGRVFAPQAIIGAALFSGDGQLLLGGDDQGRLRLWDPEGNREVGVTFSGHSQPIIDASMSADGRLLATLGRDQSVRFWTLGEDYPLAREFRVGGVKVRSVAHAPDGQRLATGDDSGLVRLWDQRQPDHPRELTLHDAGVWALAFSPSADLLASADRAGTVRVTDLASGLARHQLAASGAVWSLSFVPDRLLIAASDHALEIWPLDDTGAHRTIRHPSGRITRMALAPSGDRVATSSSDGRVRLYDTAQGRLLQELTVDQDMVWSLAFSPSGDLVATASGDEVVAVWTLADGKRRALFSGHTGGATDVAFLADGMTLVVTDRSGSLHWWDLHTQRKLTAPIAAHAESSWRLAVHPDGHTVATAGDDGSTKVWDILSVERACEFGQPSLDQGRRQQYLGVGAKSLACDPKPRPDQSQR